MASSIEEFRRLIYKDEEIVLPSGLTARIRKIFSWDFLGLGELPVPKGGASNDEQAAISDAQTLAQKRYNDRALVKGVVSPKLTDAVDDGGEPVCLPDRLHVSELCEADYNALASAIVQWCSLTQEAGQAIESFRDHQNRAAGESVGGAVSLPAQ